MIKIGHDKIETEVAGDSGKHVEQDGAVYAAGNRNDKASAFGEGCLVPKRVPNRFHEHGWIVASCMRSCNGSGQWLRCRR